jgi:hypothetical protein
MALLAWLLIAFGLCAPLLTAYFTSANMRAAGYSSGAGLLLSIVVIVVSIVRARSIDPQRRARSYLAASAIVVALSLWSSFNIFQNARIDREVASARPEINAIMQAAAAEATLINSGQLASTDVSNAWKAYATPASAVEILDRAVPLRLRLVELMRRAKSRELDLARATRAAVDAADIAGALSPHQLVSAQGRADSLARLEQYRSFMKSYADRLAALSEQATSDIRALGLPRSSEDEMVGGRVRSVRGSAAAFDQVVQQELQTIDMIQEVIRLVDAHGASAQVADGKLKLSDANAQAQYEATMLRLGFTEG